MSFNEIDPELGQKYRDHLASNVNLVRQYPEIIQSRLARLREAKEQGVDPGER